MHPAGPSEGARRRTSCRAVALWRCGAVALWRCGAVALTGGRVLCRMRRDARERGEVEVEALEAC